MHRLLKLGYDTLYNVSGVTRLLSRGFRDCLRLASCSEPRPSMCTYNIFSTLSEQHTHATLFLFSNWVVFAMYCVHTTYFLLYLSKHTHNNSFFILPLMAYTSSNNWVAFAMFCPSFKRGLNLIENAVVVKLSKIMAFKICPQRQFCEFLQNSSEFVLASVLGNPNSNFSCRFSDWFHGIFQPNFPKTN